MKSLSKLMLSSVELVDTNGGLYTSDYSPPEYTLCIQHWNRANLFAEEGGSLTL